MSKEVAAVVELAELAYDTKKDDAYAIGVALIEYGAKHAFSLIDYATESIAPRLIWGLVAASKCRAWPVMIAVENADRALAEYRKRF